MSKNQPLPAEARKHWKSSVVASPVAAARKICNANPSLTQAELVAKCVKAGIAQGTATVTCSRWRTARKK